MKSRARASRRQFLSTVATTAGAAMLLPSRSGWAYTTDSRVADIVAKTVGIDTHNHIDVPVTAAEMPGPSIDLTGMARPLGSEKTATMEHRMASSHELD